jgi:hypothetical protein
LELTKELICNFHVANQYNKLQGRQIDLGMDGIIVVSKLPCNGTILGAKENYNTFVTNYFTRE